MNVIKTTQRCFYTYVVLHCISELAMATSAEWQRMMTVMIIYGVPATQVGTCVCGFKWLRYTYCLYSMVIACRLKKKRFDDWDERECWEQLFDGKLFFSSSSSLLLWGRAASRSFLTFLSRSFFFIFEWGWEVKGGGQATGCRFVSFSLAVFASRFWFFSLAMTLCISRSLSPLSFTCWFHEPHFFFFFFLSLLVTFRRISFFVFLVFRKPQKKTAKLWLVLPYIHV